MAPNISVFLDSDVVVAGLLSKTGAAHFLLFQKDILRIVSNCSIEELGGVIARLNIKKEALDEVLKAITVVEIKKTKPQIKETFGRYVTDPNDAHIIAGAKEAKTRFLLTYNQKHYLNDLIKSKLGVSVLTPAQFLQYLRSLA